MLAALAVAASTSLGKAELPEEINRGNVEGIHASLEPRHATRGRGPGQESPYRFLGVTLTTMLSDDHVSDLHFSLPFWRTMEARLADHGGIALTTVTGPLKEKESRNPANGRRVPLGVHLGVHLGVVA